MPIYDYSCSSCGHVTEVIHGIYDQAPRFCPACGKEGTLKKSFAAPAVHFKGSGWAKKDRKATSAPGKAPAKTATSTDEGAGASSDAASSAASGGETKAASASDD